MTEIWSRQIFLSLFLILFGLTALEGYYHPLFYSALFLLVPTFLLGLYDMLQKGHAVLRNYPLLGHFRYILESVRPEIRQYFIDSDTDENPFSREMRSLVYQRAKGQRDTVPFGTQLDVNALGYEWIGHSLNPKKVELKNARVVIGESRCSKPYSASLFNISAMSYGSLSRNAVLALNSGAKIGDFYHNTGEGGLTPYHLRYKADLVWEIGTSYFGCRTKEGKFSPDFFKEKAAKEEIKMIEIKLSQGAKPGHGGLLPKAKLTQEIAEIRGVEMGHDVHSPAAHSAFASPIGLLEFVTQLRELSGGKPVGFKLCLGHPQEWFAIVKAMLQTKLVPDFITVDGGEGGTGAAPLEFSNYVGMPSTEGLVLVHQTLRGVGLRKKIKINTSSKVVTAFHLLQKLALGADFTCSARAMMFALGCIQALRCNTNNCPTGVASQNPKLYGGLVIDDKARRVANFHRKTIEGVLELLGAAGFSSPSELGPQHIFRRTAVGKVQSLAEIYPRIEENAFLENEIPAQWQKFWKEASAERF
ncbi:MAG: FMN-binding glutamate synthase family protein [Deltaproteobacteria bacterium]|nr:FMN-binding glutamate synthase family protein [Deltaproteobacteria bacterium]